MNEQQRRVRSKTTQPIEAVVLGEYGLVLWVLVDGNIEPTTTYAVNWEDIPAPPTVVRRPEVYVSSADARHVSWVAWFTGQTPAGHVIVMSDGNVSWEPNT